MKNTIVIATDIHDFTADSIIPLLEERVDNVVRFNFSSAAMDMVYASEIGSDSSQTSIYIENSNRHINTGDIKSIWWRKPEHIIFPEDFEDNHLQFARKEIFQYISGVFQSADAFWISNPDKIFSASRKVEQLKRAKKFGFSIPETLFTTSIDSLVPFYNRFNGKIIYKVMSGPFLGLSPNDRARMVDSLEELGAPLITKTTPVSEQALLSFGERQFVPCLFQQYIEKKYEIRLTIVGNKVFPAAIFSQENEQTKVDWRDYSVTTRYETVDIPAELEKKCVDFMRSYGLEYSAMDFVVTPNDEYVFLENNPNGQFSFIENAVPELEISKAIVDLLVNPPS